MLELDARLVGPIERRAIVLGCRRPLDGSANGYRLAISPEFGRFALFDNLTITLL